MGKMCKQVASNSGIRSHSMSTGALSSEVAHCSSSYVIVVGMHGCNTHA